MAAHPAGDSVDPNDLPEGRADPQAVAHLARQQKRGRMSGLWAKQEVRGAIGDEKPLGKQGGVGEGWSVTDRGGGWDAIGDVPVAHPSSLHTSLLPINDQAKEGGAVPDRSSSVVLPPLDEDDPLDVMQV